MNRKTLTTFAAAVAASLMFPSFSEAETVNTTADLLNNKTAVAYVFSPSMLETMYRLGVQEDKKFGLQSNCRSQYHVKPISAVVLKPIEFPEGKQIGRASCRDR